jgi:hypothetical protein
MLDFSTLKLSNHEPLHTAGRKICVKCNKQRAFLCQDCVLALTDDTPTLRLPVKVLPSLVAVKAELKGQ